MCIRDRDGDLDVFVANQDGDTNGFFRNDAGHFTDVARELGCLLYTSDAADERSSVDLGGRRIIKKKKNTQ